MVFSQRSMKMSRSEQRVPSISLFPKLKQDGFSGKFISLLFRDPGDRRLRVIALRHENKRQRTWRRTCCAAWCEAGSQCRCLRGQCPSAGQTLPWQRSGRRESPGTPHPKWGFFCCSCKKKSVKLYPLSAACDRWKLEGNLNQILKIPWQWAY